MTQQPPRNVGPDLGDEQSTSLPAPFPAAQIETVEARHRPRRGRLWWSALFLGGAKFVVGITQSLLAATIRSKGIEPKGYWFAEIMLPIAGETLTGKLAVISAIWFLMMITLDGQQPSVCWVILYVVCLLFTAGSFGIGFVLTFGQKAVYKVLREYDKCISNVNGNYSFDWGGDCACFASVSVAVDDAEEIVRTNGIGVDVAHDTPCNTVPDYVDAIGASYGLMIALLVLIVVVLRLHCLVQRRSQYARD